MKPTLLVAACAAVMALAGAAHAEKWTYFPVPGGALAYETDGIKVDLTQGQTEGDTLTYYFVPRAIGQNAYSILIQRLDFRCRANQYRIIGLVYFDDVGHTVADGSGGDWTPMPSAGSPIAAFGHLFCSPDRPPGAKETGDRDALLPLLRALPPTTTLSKGAAGSPSSITLPTPKP